VFLYPVVRNTELEGRKEREEREKSDPRKRARKKVGNW